MSDEIIKVKDVSFIYPAGVTALRDVNLSVKQGEVLVIIGHNGSGKTTLVKHFNGLLKPTKGEVYINKTSTKKLTTAKLSQRVGYVFQNPDDQIFHSKTYDEAAFGPKNLKLDDKEIKRRVNEALEMVGLNKFKNVHPLDLNLSQKKLLAIASIIAMNPEIIILDEPLTGQDHEGVRKVELLINELKKNHTIILISHNMQLASKVASRVLIMKDTKVLFEGNPKEVFKKTDLLAETDVKPPVITQLAQKIKGFKDDVLTVDEFVSEVGRFRKK